MKIAGQVIVSGNAAGEVIYTDVPLSMMGGTNPLRGLVIDTHHPLHGQTITDKILVIPGGRGSCAGSAALFEMIINDTEPAALVLSRTDTILALGSIIARELFHVSIPIICADPETHASLSTAQTIAISGSTLIIDEDISSDASEESDTPANAEYTLELSDKDERILAGEFGEAAQVAMRIVCQAAELEGATELVDIEKAHIDGNFYQGPGSVSFAQRMKELGAKVAVPSTMNSLRGDRRRWRDQGVDSHLGEASEVITDAYLAMGVSPSYTCAPYLLSNAPRFGQQIGWAESIAVDYANSVLGARTLKYSDYLDLMVAITGRAPAAGTHLPEVRRARLHVNIEYLEKPDDSLFPLLGYLVGELAEEDIPAITGLEQLAPSTDDLRAFGAAFATTSSAPMFHIVGVTPEAPLLADVLGHLPPARTIEIAKSDLQKTWREMNSSDLERIDLVSLGNPYFSLTEAERLTELCEGRSINPSTQTLITCSREIYDHACQKGLVHKLEEFGEVRALWSRCDWAWPALW